MSKSTNAPIDEQTSSLSETADRISSTLDTVNKKVDAKRASILSNPDSFSDRIIKSAVPAIASALLGQAISFGWKKQTNGKAKPNAKDTSTSLLQSVLFSGITAAITAFVVRIATLGSQSWVARRQRKRK